MRVGVAQIDVKIRDREINFETIRRWLEEYWTPSESETLVVLPELFDVGYAIRDAERYGDRNAEQAAEFLSSLAKKYGIWFAGGSVLCNTDDGAVNRALVINPQGEYVAHYDKVHLIPLMQEDVYLKAGQSECRFKTCEAVCAISICYDIRFCEWQRLSALRGAQVLFVSAEWPAARINHWTALLKARAIENMMYVVACNRAGTTKDTQFGGHSLIIDPWGEILFEGTDKPCGAFAEIAPQKSDEIREYLKVFKVRKARLYRE